MQSLLDPKNDVVFKMLFTRKQHHQLLHSLLTSVLNPVEPIVELEILNPDLPKNIVGDRSVILDIHVKLANGEHVNIEMQMAHQKQIWARMHYHWARLFSQQALTGSRFLQLRPATVIFFNKFKEFNVPQEDYHLGFSLQERKNRVFPNEYIKLEIIQLPQILLLPNRTQGDDNSQMLLAWSRFLMDPMREEWRAELMSNPVIREAHAALHALSEDVEARELARAREMGEMDLESIREECIQEGIQEGIQKGIQKGIQEGISLGLKESAIRMSKNGMGLTDIAKILEISEAELKEWLS